MMDRSALNTLFTAMTFPSDHAVLGGMPVCNRWRFSFRVLLSSTKDATAVAVAAVPISGVLYLFAFYSPCMRQNGAQLLTCLLVPLVKPHPIPTSEDSMLLSGVVSLRYEQRCSATTQGTYACVLLGCKLTPKSRRVGKHSSCSWKIANIHCSFRQCPYRGLNFGRFPNMNLVNRNCCAKGGGNSGTRQNSSCPSK